MSMQNGNSAGNGANLDRLLGELHAKKKWLDEVIGGLEQALISPDMQFVSSITKTFGEEPNSRPKVDLRSRQRRKLARLASRVITARAAGSQNPVARAESARASSGAKNGWRVTAAIAWVGWVGGALAMLSEVSPAGTLL